MNAPVTLESLARRVEALEAQAAAPRWTAGLDGFDQSDEAVAFRRQIDDEVQKARADDRAQSVPLVRKDWRRAVGRITNLELFDEVVAAGEAIRRAEIDHTEDGEAA